MDLGLRTSREMSEEVSKDIDNEVKKLIFDTHARVKGILEENKGRLETLAKLLLEKEVIEGEELRKIISETALIPKKKSSA